MAHVMALKEQRSFRDHRFSGNEQSSPDIRLRLGGADLIDDFAVCVKKRQARDSVNGDL